MNYEIIVALICIGYGLTIAGLLVGCTLLKDAYRKRTKEGKFNLKLLITGWSLVSTLSLFLTITVIFLMVNYGYTVLGVITIFSPFLFLIILIVSISAGGSLIAEGRSESKKGDETVKQAGKKKVTGGSILLAVALTLIVVAIILFVTLLGFLSTLHIGAM